MSRSVPTNETVREGETRTGEKSEDCKLQSQPTGGELSIDIDYFMIVFSLVPVKYFCVNLVTIIVFRRYLLKENVPLFPPLPTWLRVLIFSRAWVRFVYFPASWTRVLTFSRLVLGRGGDYQAKLRNTVVNDERPFVWNERKINFTAGRNWGAEERQA